MINTRPLDPHSISVGGGNALSNCITRNKTQQRRRRTRRVKAKVAVLYLANSANFRRLRLTLTEDSCKDSETFSSAEATCPSTWISHLRRCPEPTFLESLLRYGLFMGAVFQLICILAVLIPSSKSHHEQEAEPQDARANDQAKKPKGPLPQIRQKVKKESKKKR